MVNKYIFIVDLFYGILLSDCSLPCLRTSAKIEKKMTTTKIEDSTTQLSFNVDNKVRVKKTSVIRFSFLDSLNYFGSNLGLWPGLGLYQILERLLGLLIATQIIGKCRRLVSTH